MSPAVRNLHGTPTWRLARRALLLVAATCAAAVALLVALQYAGPGVSVPQAHAALPQAPAAEQPERSRMDDR